MVGGNDVGRNVPALMTVYWYEVLWKLGLAASAVIHHLAAVSISAAWRVTNIRLAKLSMTWRAVEKVPRRESWKYQYRRLAISGVSAAEMRPAAMTYVAGNPIPSLPVLFDPVRYT